MDSRATRPQPPPTTPASRLWPRGHSTPPRDGERVLGMRQHDPRADGPEIPRVYTWKRRTEPPARYSRAGLPPEVGPTPDPDRLVLCKRPR